MAMSESQPPFNVQPPHNFSLGALQPSQQQQQGQQSQIHQLSGSDQQVAQNLMASREQEQRQRMMALQMGRQDGGFGQPQQMSRMAEMLRNNPQFQQSPQHQQQLQHLQQMSQLGHSTPGAISMPQPNVMQNHGNNQQPGMAQQQQQQQLEQMLRNNAANANPFQNRRMAISADPAINRQLELLRNGDGIRPPSANLQGRTPLAPHQQQGTSPQPAHQQPFMNAQLQHQLGGQNPGAMGLSNPQQLMFGGANGAQQAGNFGPSPQMQQMNSITSYAQCLAQFQQVKEEVSRMESQISMTSQHRPDAQTVSLIPQMHATLTRRKHLLNMLQSMLEKTPFPDRPTQNSQNGPGRVGGSSPNPTQQQQQIANGQASWSTSPTPIFPGAPTPVSTNPDIQQQLLRLQYQGANQSRFLQMQSLLQQQAQQQSQQQQQQQPGQNAPNQQAPGQQQQGFPPQPFMNQARPSQGGGPGPSQNPTQMADNQFALQQQAQAIARSKSAAAEMANQIQKPQGGIIRPPPLEKGKFEQTMVNWFQKQRQAVPAALHGTNIDGHVFSLWDVHREVMNHGTYHNVNAQNLWSVIAVKLGFPPAHGQPGPPKASERIGDILRDMHNKYLLPIENLYLTSLMNGARNAAAASAAAVAAAGGQQQQQQQPPVNAGQPQNGVTNAGPSQPNADVVNRNTPLPQASHLPPQITEEQVNQLSQDELLKLAQQSPNRELLPYAGMSPEEMRERGIHESIITNVNRSRALLHRQVMLLSQRGNMGGPDMNRQPLAPGMQQRGQNQNLQPPIMPGQDVRRPDGTQNMPDLSPNLTPQQQQQQQQQQMWVQRVQAQIQHFGSLITGGLPPPGHPGGPPLTRPTQEIIGHAEGCVRLMKTHLEKTMPTNPVVVPENELPEWRNMLQLVLSQHAEVERAIVPYLAVFKDMPTMKKLCVYLLVISRQQQRYATVPNTYLVSLDMLKNINGMFKQVLMRLREATTSLNGGPRLTGPGPPGLPGTDPNAQLQYQNHPPAIPPTSIPQPNSIPPEIPRAPSAQRIPTPQQQQGPSISKVGRAANGLNKPIGAVSTPSPAAAATPAATPNASASSPPKTPKSPGKKPPKKAAPKRGKAAAAASPQNTAPTPTDSSSLKRSRPEEGSPEETKPTPNTEVTTQTPPQKRTKLNSEWEAPDPTAPETTSVKEDESEKTDQQVIAELEEIFASNGNQIIPEIQASFDSITSQMYGFPEASTSALPNNLVPKMEPPPIGPDVFEFIDFSQFEDSDPAATTPDLVATGSSGPSNCSPESAPDSEAANAARAAIIEKQKVAPLQEPLKYEPIDPTAAILTELEGGFGSTYYFDEWRWDGNMPPADWAISTS